MKSVLLAIVGFVFSLSAFSQITSAEYFYDTDPGFGNGTPLSLSGTILDENISISTVGLPEGVHNLYVRVLNEDGIWSLYGKNVVYVSSDTNNTSSVISAEYFYDIDPGLGNGVALSISGNVIDQNISIPTTGLSDGVHKLYIRVQNQDNIWSLYAKDVIYVSANNTNTATIVSAEYFFDIDPGVGLGTSIDVTDGALVDEDLTLDVPSDLPDGDHMVYIRTLNQEGKYSLYAVTEVSTTLSVNDYSVTNIKLYPNPVKDILYFNTNSQPIIDFKVIDIMGKIIRHQVPSNDYINLEDLPNGAYLIQIKTEVGSISKKIIKK